MDEYCYKVSNYSRHYYVAEHIRGELLTIFMPECAVWTNDSALSPNHKYFCH